ncbi:MAG: DMT family transporter [Bacteroidetes bacterium]|nr:DMT family transporter [Bacteroidota bacterium]
MVNEKEKWIILFLLTLIWGSSFILIKKSLMYFSPYQVGSLRVLVASLLLLPYALLNIKKLPKKQLKWIVLSALIGNFFPMFLFPLAETEISSSIAGIINSMMPIFIILITIIFWKNETNNRQIIGVSISFIGAVILMMGNGEMGEVKWVPIGFLLLATLLYAINSITVKKKLLHIEPKLLSAFVFGIVLFFPSLISLSFSGFFNEIQWTSEVFFGLLFVVALAVLGTGLAMMLNYRLLYISNAVFASTVTLLMPIVAVIWGLLDGEKLSLAQIIGASIILAGLLFLRSKLPSKK